jgi:hypothetical protein
MPQFNPPQFTTDNDKSKKFMIGKDGAGNSKVNFTYIQSNKILPDFNADGLYNSVNNLRNRYNGLFNNRWGGSWGDEWNGYRSDVNGRSQVRYAIEHGDQATRYAEHECCRDEDKKNHLRNVRYSLQQWSIDGVNQLHNDFNNQQCVKDDCKLEEKSTDYSNLLNMVTQYRDYLGGDDVIKTNIINYYKGLISDLNNRISMVDASNTLTNQIINNYQTLVDPKKGTTIEANNLSINSLKIIQSESKALQKTNTEKIDDMHNKIKAQNETLTSQHNKMIGYQTKNQRLYENQRLSAESLSILNYTLISIYSLLVLIFIGLTVFVKDRRTLIIRIIIISLLIVIPMFKEYIETNIYLLYKLSVSIITGSPFNKDIYADTTNKSGLPLGGNPLTNNGFIYYDEASNNKNVDSESKFTDLQNASIMFSRIAGYFMSFFQ